MIISMLFMLFSGLSGPPAATPAMAPAQATFECLKKLEGSWTATSKVVFHFVDENHFSSQWTRFANGHEEWLELISATRKGASGRWVGRE